MRTYSDFFKTLHDETGPTGYLGRGTHCSVLRAVVFHDPMGRSLPKGQFADFAVIWDEDHDARVMEPIEKIYRDGLLSSFAMFGERQGCFTAILSSSAIKAPFNPAFLMRVHQLNLSPRPANCLKSDDTAYVGELVQKTEGEMLRITNLGRKGLNEIKEVLAENGLYFGMEVPGWSEYRKRVAFLEVKINAICQSLKDPWFSKVVMLGGDEMTIINDEDEKVNLYLNSLVMLWQLGTSAAQTQEPATLVSEDGNRAVRAPAMVGMSSG